MQQETKEQQKKIQSNMDFVSKNYAGFVKVLNGKRPQVYVEIKYWELADYIVKTCNGLNTIYQQLLQLKMNISERKISAKKDDPQHKEETDNLIIILYDLTQWHTITRQRWLDNCHEMMKRKVMPHWGAGQLEYWGKFHLACRCAIMRVF